MTKISESEIRHNSAQIRNEIEFLNLVIKRMDEVKEELGNAWSDGSTRKNAERYLEAITEKQTDLKAIIDKIAELPDILDKAAENARAAGEGGQA